MSYTGDVGDLASRLAYAKEQFAEAEDELIQIAGKKLETQQIAVIERIFGVNLAGTTNVRLETSSDPSGDSLFILNYELIGVSDPMLGKSTKILSISSYL